MFQCYEAVRSIVSAITLREIQRQPRACDRSNNSPQKHAWRARIVVLSADGVGTMPIQRQTGKGKPNDQVFAGALYGEGVDGLLHEATRPAGKSSLLPETWLERHPSFHFHFTPTSASRLNAVDFIAASSRTVNSSIEL
jgi:hypothetical protein